MSRLRRIELCQRIFFVTTNLAEDTPPLSAGERDVLLKHLADVRATFGFSLLGYVLMPNHAHLVLQVLDRPLSGIMHRWKFRSAYGLQQDRAARGRFWQARYFDFICRRARDVADKLNYAHENPVVAGLVERAEEWRWSSAGYYSGKATPPLIPDRVEFGEDPETLLWPDR